MAKAKAKDNSMHWIIGVVLLITGVLIIAALVVTYSQGEDVNANVNIDNDPPVIDSGNAQIWHDSGDDGTNTASTVAVAPGPTFPHTLKGNTNVIVKVNVSDSNGWASQPTNISMRLIRTTGSGTSLALGAFETAGSDETLALPKAAPSSCSAIANVSATERTFLCGINMKFVSDPTTATSEVASGVNYQAEHWRAAFKASDGVVNVSETDTIHYEFAEQIGLTTGALVDLGSIATDGTPAASVTLAVDNDGNQTIDATTQATETVDATAWTCTGTGNPLISDLHIAAVDATYGTKPALPVNGSPATLTGFDQPRDTDSLSRTPKNLFFQMATTQAITPGTCTLSSVILTAIKGF